MIHIIIGSRLTTAFFLVLSHLRKNNLKLAALRRRLTLLGFLYVLFVLEVITAFALEGSARGASVMGVLLGFFAVLWAVLLSRSIFVSKKGDTNA